MGTRRVVSDLITLLFPGRVVGMYLRTTQRKNRDGTVVRYAQLAHNRRVDAHFIAGMRMRDGNPLVEQVLSRQGRYQQVKENLRVKEARLDDQTDARFIICHNPEQAERDRAHREDAITRLEVELERIKQARERDRKRKTSKNAKAKAEATHTKAECALREHPTLGRWLRQSPSGRLSINRAKIKQEERLDGKYLIATSDPHISAEDTALGYKNLLEAEYQLSRLPRPEVIAAAQTGISSARTPHPRTRSDLLARPAARPRRRTPRQHDLAPHQHRAQPRARRDADRQRRHRRAHHPAHHHPSRHSARLSDPRTRHRHRPRPRLTRPNTTQEPSKTRRHTHPRRRYPRFRRSHHESRSLM